MSAAATQLFDLLVYVQCARERGNAADLKHATYWVQSQAAALIAGNY